MKLKACATFEVLSEAEFRISAVKFAYTYKIYENGALFNTGSRY